MVDLQTAMAAAAAERKQRSVKPVRKGRYEEVDQILASSLFDPVKHVKKEKADTASMWLVLSYAVIVSLMMRFVLMPNTSPEKIRYSVLDATSMIILIPQLHRMVMPKSFQEFYGKGTWFKAGFLHTFTFLAMAFLLVNPQWGT